MQLVVLRASGCRRASGLTWPRASGLIDMRRAFGTGPTVVAAPRCSSARATGSGTPVPHHRQCALLATAPGEHVSNELRETYAIVGAGFAGLATAFHLLVRLAARWLHSLIWRTPAETHARHIAHDYVSRHDATPALQSQHDCESSLAQRSCSTL